jgi:hypothetical protein
MTAYVVVGAGPGGVTVTHGSCRWSGRSGTVVSLHATFTSRAVFSGALGQRWGSEAAVAIVPGCSQPCVSLPALPSGTLCSLLWLFFCVFLSFTFVVLKALPGTLPCVACEAACACKYGAVCSCLLVFFLWAFQAVCRTRAPAAPAGVYVHASALRFGLS